MPIDLKDLQQGQVTDENMPVNLLENGRRASKVRWQDEEEMKPTVADESVEGVEKPETVERVVEVLAELKVE